MKYEVHLTVANILDRNEFKAHCDSLNIKPIFLHLHALNSKLNDIMTSSIFDGDDISVKEYSMSLYNKLTNYGYNIIRIKIETPPYHHLCPTESNGLIHLTHNYYETHIPVVVNDINNLITLCHNNDVHVSKNIFKKYHDGEVYMVTLRNKCSLEKFIIKLDIIKHLLIDNGYTILKKHHIEFCLYDSNVDHDNNWIYWK